MLLPKLYICHCLNFSEARWNAAVTTGKPSAPLMELCNKTDSKNPNCQTGEKNIYNKEGNIHFWEKYQVSEKQTVLRWAYFDRPSCGGL